MYKYQKKTEPFKKPREFYFEQPKYFTNEEILKKEMEFREKQNEVDPDSNYFQEYEEEEEEIEEEIEEEDDDEEEEYEGRIDSIEDTLDMLEEMVQDGEDSIEW
eukprot:gene5402-9215_t